MRWRRVIPVGILTVGLSWWGDVASAQQPTADPLYDYLIRIAQVPEELPVPAEVSPAPSRGQPTPALRPPELRGPVFTPAPRANSASAAPLEPSAEILPLDSADGRPSVPLTSVREMIQERYPSGTLKLEREMVQDEDGNYVLDGSWRLFTEKGQSLAEGEYRRDERHGVWRRTHLKNDSDLFSSPPYKDFQAPFTSEATFDEGKLHGTWTIMDARNRKVSEVNYERGVRHGQSIWWQPNGTPLMQAQFERGELQGESFTLDARGQATSRVRYEQGWKLETKTEKFPNGKPKSQAGMLVGHWKLAGEDDWWNARPAKFVVEGTPKPHGKTVTYHANGQIQSEREFDHGKPVGTLVWHHENGLKALEGMFDDEGKPIGRWTWWHASGMKSIEGDYDHGDARGNWTWWNEQGKIARKGPLEGGMAPDSVLVSTSAANASPIKLGQPRPSP